MSIKRIVVRGNATALSDAEAAAEVQTFITAHQNDSLLTSDLNESNGTIKQELLVQLQSVADNLGAPSGLSSGAMVRT